MIEIAALSDREFELIKITLKVLKNFSKFDNIKIYQAEKHFEIHTTCLSEKYITKTKISRCFWKVTECICSKFGEKEIKII